MKTEKRPRKNTKRPDDIFLLKKLNGSYISPENEIPEGNK
jgi:hypothetical protein